MSAKQCCVPGCGNTRTANTILHLFPDPKTDLDRFTIWVKTVGGHHLAMDPHDIFRRRRICHVHFEKKYHTWSNRLSRNAIPTLHLKASTNEIAYDENNPAPSTSQSLQTQRTPFASTNEIAYDENNPAPSTSQSLQTQRTPFASLENSLNLPKPKALKRDATIKEPAKLFSIGKNKWSRSTQDLEVKKIENKMKILQKSKVELVSKLKKAKKLIECPNFKKNMKKMSVPAKIFTNLQFRETKKKMLGRRFTKEEKVLALAIFKQGPKTYRWLRKYFVLPSPVTISRMLMNANIKPGINTKIMNNLRKRVTKMKENEKVCALLFDEMALSPHFDYNSRNDKIMGFTDDHNGFGNKIADHVLVFMIRGVFKNYKQPIAYSFCSKTTPTIELVSWLKEIITQLQNIGFKIIATICDQGATNVSSINHFINETKEKYLRQQKEQRNTTFEINGYEIIPLYDPPHLIKGIRNNLLTKNLECFMKGQKKTANWDHILKVYNADQTDQGLRIMPKLTDKHVVPSKIAKMKVKCATQVLSQTVASTMGFLVRYNIIPKECQETADVILFFDKLFDSLNGSFNKSRTKSGKPLLNAVTPRSTHKVFWQEAKIILRSMKFIKNGKPMIVPSIKNLILTIDNVELLIKRLSAEYGLTSIWMRHLNQDPLENFFGSVRSHGCRNNSPTCAGFEAAFTSLLVSNLSVHSAGANCEMDECKVFEALTEIFFEKSSMEMSSRTAEVDFDDLNINIIDFDVKKQNLKIKSQVEYVAGYVLRKSKRKIFKNCINCNNILFGSSKASFNYREYYENKTCLTYPSIKMIKCFSAIQDVIISIIRNKSYIKNIKMYVKTILSIVIDYNFINCNVHKIDLIDYLENISIILFIHTWCRNTNKLFSGLRADYDDCDTIQRLAYDYYIKMKKK